jgi:hypothetical protein
MADYERSDPREVPTQLEIGTSREVVGKEGREVPKRNERFLLSLREIGTGRALPDERCLPRKAVFHERCQPQHR